MSDMVFTNLVKKGQKIMKKKNLAFTLAEVLIVIGIIGVVAALTLPNLNHATGDKEKVTKVKKIYSALTEAVDRAQAIYGPFDTWFKDLSTADEKSVIRKSHENPAVIKRNNYGDIIKTNIRQEDRFI